MVQSLSEAQQLCELAVARWFDRHANVTVPKSVEEVFDDALERGVAQRFALRVLTDQCKTVTYPASAAAVANLTACAIARTLRL
jgi:hypothetical protein